MVAALRAGRAPPYQAGAWTVVVYDEDDRVALQADAGGGRVTIGRNQAGYVSRVIELGEPTTVTSVAYDAMARPRSVIVSEEQGAALRATQLRHDGFGRTVGVQQRGVLPAPGGDPWGRFDEDCGTVSWVTFDSLDREVEAWVEGPTGSGDNDPCTPDRAVLGQTFRELNEAGAALRALDLAVDQELSEPAGPGLLHLFAHTTTTYDAALRPVEVELKGVEETSTFEYDGFGLARATAPNLIVDRLVDPDARVITEVRESVPDGPGAHTGLAVVEQHLDGAYRPFRSVRYEAEYAGDGELSSVGPILVSDVMYDGHGQPLEVITESGRGMRREYDAGGRVETLVEGVLEDDTLTELRRTELDYDPLGRLTQERAAVGQGKRLVYDEQGRLLREILGDRLPELGQTVRSFTWDAAGRLTFDDRERADGTIRTVELQYSDNSTAPETVLVDGFVVQSFVRDGLERVTSATDHNFVLPADRPGAGLLDQDPTVTSYLRYDTLGRVRSDDADHLSPTGVEQQLGAVLTGYESDFLGPVSAGVQLAREGFTFSYSDKGNLQTLVRGVGTSALETTFSWQGGLWVRATTPTGLSQPFRMSKPRDGFGRMVTSSLTGPDGTVTGVERYREEILYGPDSRIVAEHRAGPWSGVSAKSYSYDGLARLEEHGFADTSAPSASAFAAYRADPVVGADEELGANVISADHNTTVDFAELIETLEGSGADEHGRDFVAAYDTTVAGAPPRTVDGANVTLDADRRISRDGRFLYVYDALDRLRAVVDDTGVALAIAHDASGRRRVETRDGAEVALFWLGGNVVSEVEVGTTNVLRATTYAPGLDAPLYVAAGPPALGEPSLAMLGTNRRGDVVVALSAADGTVLEEATLGPWGNRTVLAADGASCVAVGAEVISGAAGCGAVVVDGVLSGFGIAGGRAHSATGIVDLRARGYAPHLRGFLTRDPLGSRDSQALWSYVAGDPVNYVDRLGRSRNPTVSPGLLPFLLGMLSVGLPRLPPGMIPPPPMGAPAPNGPPGRVPLQAPTPNSPPARAPGSGPAAPRGFPGGTNLGRFLRYGLGAGLVVVPMMATSSPITTGPSCENVVGGCMLAATRNTVRDVIGRDPEDVIYDELVERGGPEATSNEVVITDISNIVNPDPTLGPNQIRIQVDVTDFFGNFRQLSVNLDLDTGAVGIIKPASGK